MLHLALRAPEARKAHSGAEFPGFCLLLAGDRECAFQVRFRLWGWSGLVDLNASSPAMRLTSASNKVSLPMSTAAIASST